MTTTIATSVRNAATNATTALLDAGATNGVVEVRTGAQPANPDVAATGTLLATGSLSDPAFGAAAGGTATADAIGSETNAPNSGTAGWFRAYDSNGNAVIDGACRASADPDNGEEMVLDTTTITAGDIVNFLSWTITIPVSE